AGVMPFLIRTLAPLVWLSQQLTKLITRGRPPPAPRHRDELMTVASMGEDAGQLHPGETRLVHNLLQLDAIKTADIMTPRTVVFSLPADTRLDGFVEAVKDSPFTRIPVHGPDDSADITGFVIKGEVLMQCITGDDADATLAGLARPRSARAMRRARPFAGSAWGPAKPSSTVAVNSCSQRSYISGVNGVRACTGSWARSGLRAP